MFQSFGYSFLVALSPLSCIHPPFECFNFFGYSFLVTLSSLSCIHPPFECLNFLVNGALFGLSFPVVLLYSYGKINSLYFQLRFGPSSKHTEKMGTRGLGGIFCVYRIAIAMPRCHRNLGLKGPSSGVEIEGSLFRVQERKHQWKIRIWKSQFLKGGS